MLRLLLIIAYASLGFSQSFPVNCGPNEVFDTCGSACEPSCRNPNPTICTLQCVVGCRCRQGFFRDDFGQCVASCGRPSQPVQAGPISPPSKPSPVANPPSPSRPSPIPAPAPAPKPTPVIRPPSPPRPSPTPAPPPPPKPTAAPKPPSPPRPSPTPAPPPPPKPTAVPKPPSPPRPSPTPAPAPAPKPTPAILPPSPPRPSPTSAPPPPPKPLPVPKPPLPPQPSAPSPPGHSQQCPRNESWSKCPTQCEPTCSNMNPKCNKACGEPKCQCDEGFFRNRSGSCVRSSECPRRDSRESREINSRESQERRRG